MSLGARRRRPPTPGFVANNLWRRAGELPSFHISPAALGHARDLITGSALGTYNSASPAMAVGADGLLFTPAANAPVIEYNPTTLECLGARIWGVVTNLSLASEAIGGAGWVNQNSITVALNTTDVIDPAGGNKASRLTSGASGSQTLMGFTAAADVYSVGPWLRTASGSVSCNLLIFLAASPFTVILQQPITVTSKWQRFSFTSSAATAAAYNFAINVPSGTVYAYGSHINRGATLGPYVPTTTTSASSTADVWSITGADFNRIYNQSAVTLYAEAEREVVPAGDFPILLDARNNTSSEIIQISYRTENLARNFVTTGGVLQSEGYPSGLAGIRRRRVASAFETNDVAISANGSVPIDDATATMPTPDRITIGSVGGVQSLNGYIRELAIFRSRRPNANLQALTT